VTRPIFCSSLSYIMQDVSGSSCHPPSSPSVRVAFNPSTPPAASSREGASQSMDDADNSTGGSARKRQKDRHIEQRKRRHWHAFTVSELDDDREIEDEDADHCRGVKKCFDTSSSADSCLAAPSPLTNRCPHIAPTCLRSLAHARSARDLRPPARRGNASAGLIDA
jgi:hypothetical protein